MKPSLHLLKSKIYRRSDFIHMITKHRHGRGFRLLWGAFLIWLAASSPRLHAQNTYTSTPGRTIISGPYNPTSTQAPKAPVTIPAQPPGLPFLTASPAAQYDAQKAAIGKFSQSIFTGPSQVEVFPQGPRAPGAPTPVASIPTFSWQGLPTLPLLQPPSPDSAVGPSDVLMVINSSIGQFTKSGTLVQSTTFQTWFSNVLTNTCPTNCLLYDPWIVYDQLHGRFVILVSAAPAIEQSRTFSYLLLSVSNGATYGSGWTNYALNASLDGTVLTQFWGDSWRLGYDNQALYLSGNMYDVSGTFQYSKVRVLKKSDVYNPGNSLPYQDIGSNTSKLKNADGSLAFALVPIKLRGQPGAGATGLLVSSASDISVLPTNYLTVWQISNPLLTPLTMTSNTLTGGLSYNVPAAAPQLNTSATLDTGDTRILKVIYRNGFIYTARDTGYTDQATTVTYDVIDTTGSTPKLASQARLLNANSFYPAFDVPATVPLGTQFATSNMITGTTTAADGSLTYPGLSHNLKAGEGPFDIAFGTLSRWGDYFGGSVDPVSGGLWVSGEYALAPQSGFGQSSTWVGYYPWLTSAAFTDVTSASPYYDFVNVLSSWQITMGCNASTFCPTDIVTRDQMAAFVIRAMLGNNFTYTTTPYFTDVPATSVYFPYIQKMADLGLTHGCSATMYCPSNPVPRMDAAVLIVRGKLESLFGNNFTYPTTPFFSDVPASSPYFPYVQKMFELGLTLGCTATQFCPGNNLARQEMAVFLDRAFLN